MIANIINLERRPDRKEEMIQECESKGLNPVFHIAIDGQKDFFGKIHTRRMRGHAGCQQSHINLLKRIKGTQDYHLILEDDAVLTDGFKLELDNVLNKLPNDWTMCYLGGNTYLYENSVEDFDEYFYRALRVMATHCYLVKDECIDNILNVLESRYHKVDVMLMEYQLNNVVYLTKKCLSWQRESMSDIVFKKTISSPKY